MGETITVHPTSGDPYEISAVVDRDLPSPDPAFPSSHPRPVVSIDIENHPTRGVDINAFDRGTIEFELSKERPGGGTSRFGVANFSEVVGGMISVLLR